MPRKEEVVSETQGSCIELGSLELDGVSWTGDGGGRVTQPIAPIDCV